MTADNTGLGFNWTNCFMFLIGLNDISNKKCDKKKYYITNYGLKIIRLIIIPFYIHLTSQMIGLSLMGIYLKQTRLPLLIWYYYACVQGISAIQWYLLMSLKGRNTSQVQLMTKVITVKRKKMIYTLDTFVSGSLFILFILQMITFPLINVMTNNLPALVNWVITRNTENSTNYVHNFIIPCSEISSITVLIASKLYVSFFHIHLYHVAATLKEKITGLNNENKERIIKRFLEWIERRREANRRFSPLVTCWSVNLVVNFMAKNLNGFETTFKPELAPFKIFFLLCLFLFFGYCSNLSYRGFKEANCAAIKYLNQKENNNRYSVVLVNKTYHQTPENELLEVLTNDPIEPSYILSICKWKTFEINSNLPFKLFITFLLLHLIPSMFS